MKTILLTGASGFIGKHLLYILSESIEYKNEIVLLTSQGIIGFRNVIHQNYTFNKNTFLSEGISQIDYIIHCGAFIPKISSQSNDVYKCSSNINSVFHLLNNLPNIPEKIIFLSTIDVYNCSEKIIDENTLTIPNTLYGWSKLYGEKMLESWAIHYSTKHQILRVGHIYGSGEEHYEKLIPNTIRKALKGEPPLIYSKGTELRSYLHVYDCVRAIVVALNMNETYGPINLVSSQAISVKQIVQTIVNEINPNLAIEILENDVQVRDYICDDTIMRTYLINNYLSFEEGIKEEISNFSI